MVIERPLDWRTKGLPPSAEGLTGPEIGRLGLSLLAGDLMMPSAIIREEALADNIREMQAFADRNGALLCPHGKTSMSPELLRRQLEAGAWGITAATAHHVRVYRRLGIERILLANQLVGRTDLDFVISEIARDPSFDFFCLVDSADGAALLVEAVERVASARPVQVLIETGLEGGRSGVRSTAEALALARAVAAQPRLALRGVETFEGIRQARPDARLEAADMIDLALIAAHDIAAEGLFAEGEVLISAGGSGFLDLCAAKLPGRIGGQPVRRVIRPGCYVTHDSGLYARLTGPGGSRLPGLPKLEHALEVWGTVLSLPEPRLAIVGAGKRDLSYDVEPPRPLWVHRPPGEGPPNEATDMTVVAMWDQHLSLSAPDGRLAVGDLVGFGISHPCATFDRWTALLTVDGAHRVTGAVTTLF
ncbi:alanine racemase [Sphingosinicella sp. CPCC 101087]|uniref:alanine racemase n=1 Tax=Sphingosinicella sp. CPCC 101087 TaxID=2497754 RepID=UPI00197D4153|nr:alanine racemase [Sphingosinicella sp. CPCC 101087]